ncbi:RusA family crossover junction endodeoxyribonuclease [Pseudoclavibacter sp. RFBB5]|uniref:RusA family crossover junction endodeoxyribonuclease n=1 Tax=Pseudoclavibacter sp. RFBB5 TaxID=2080574 RepID=UPI001CA5C9C7|nr:RusA family crossover junction endodeoxyribonuclease [Pseudoclavibacter sp. RFBB5]
MIEFNVDGAPVQQGSKQAFGFKRADGSVGASVVDVNKKPLRAWREEVQAAASDFAGTFIKHEPLQVDVVFRMNRGVSVKRPHPSVQPDLDKLLRAVLDALTISRIYVDDAQVVASTQVKRYALPHETPGARIRVSRIEEGETP